MSALKTILIIFIGWVSTFIYLFLPENRFANPFPFYNQNISLQAYFDYAMSRVFYIVLAWIICSHYDRWEFKVVFFSLIGYLIDYLLCYNQPFAYWKMGIMYEKPSGMFIPMSYPMLMVIVFMFLIIKISITK